MSANCLHHLKDNDGGVKLQTTLSQQFPTEGPQAP